MKECITNGGYCIKEENNYCHPTECELMEKSKVTLKKISKDRYVLLIGKLEVGTFYKDELCHIVQQIDNKIM